MVICVNVTRVTVLTGRGADKVCLHTTEDSPVPGVTKEPLCLDFIAAAGDGFRYATEVLKIDDEYVEVIDMDTRKSGVPSREQAHKILEAHSKKIQSGEVER